MKDLLILFVTFIRIGLFTFGGGQAMIPLIENICVGKNKWISEEEMNNIVIIAESTPGPIAINCATYVGYKRKGFLGAIFSTFGIILPSFIIIFLIALYLDNFLEIQIIANAFKGIKLAVGVLISEVALRMLIKMKKNIFSIIIFSLSVITMLVINIFSFNFSTIYILLIAGTIGLSFFIIRNIRSRKKDNV